MKPKRIQKCNGSKVVVMGQLNRLQIGPGSKQVYIRYPTGTGRETGGHIVRSTGHESPTYRR